MRTIKAKARIRFMTESGSWYLRVLKDLREGMIVEGQYDPILKSFQFDFKGRVVTLYIGENAELID